MQESVRQYLSQIGSKGGMKATGDKKRRPREHYQRIQAISAANRRAGLVKTKAKPVPPARSARAREFLEAILRTKKAPSAVRERGPLPEFGKAPGPVSPPPR